MAFERHSGAAKVYGIAQRKRNCPYWPLPVFPPPPPAIACIVIAVPPVTLGTQETG